MQVGQMVYAEDNGTEVVGTITEIRETAHGKIFTVDDGKHELWYCDWQLREFEPATTAQINYLNLLNVRIEEKMSKERASTLIDAAKGSYLGSVWGFYKDGTN